MFSERVQNYGTEPRYLNNAAAGETKKRNAEHDLAESSLCHEGMNHQECIMIWFWPTVIFKNMDLKTIAR
jgi:hypothetical protein